MEKEKLLSRGGKMVLPWVVFANSLVCGILVVKSSWVDWSVSAREKHSKMACFK